MRRTHTTLISVLTGLVLFLFVYFGYYSQDVQVDISELVSDPGQVCQQPKLSLYPNKQFRNFFTEVRKPVCGEEDWVYTHGGTVKFSKSAVDKYGKFRCVSRDIVRENDYLTSLGEEREVKDGQAMLSDLFHVKCWNGLLTYRNFHAGIVPKPTVMDTKAQGLDMNILIFGFDSVSRLTWERKLPVTYRYLVGELGAVVLEGYNIVGDATTAALLPILTGKFPDESFTDPVDSYPWIWNDLKQLGFVTQYTEDCSSYNTFNFKMKGFNKVPTDHYMRPFYLRTEYVMNSLNSFCLGSKYRHNIMFDWIQEFYSSYPSNRKFTFAFHNQLSHDESNPLSIVDEDLRDFLARMKVGSVLDRTFVMVMSDHGARYPSLRNTEQGNYEERNPFFSIIPPRWFIDKYPEQYAALLSNRRRLTTPFDIHETLRSIIDFKQPEIGDLTKRGISLFSRVPKERTCKHAGISPHWCGCLHHQNMDVNDPFTQRAAAEFINHLNSVLPKRLCRDLSLVEIFRAVKLVSNPDFTEHSDQVKSDEYYQLSVRTQPGAGSFEFTALYRPGEGRVRVNSASISRTNRYGNVSACVGHEYPAMRPYCVCRKT